MNSENQDNFYLKFKTPITYAIIVILAGGIFFYTQINSSLFPEITFPKIKVIADNGEQPIDKMMITVTKPLEEAIKQTPDLTLVKSTTSRGSCEISAFLDWKADINVSQSLMESRINQIRNELPPSTNITIEQMNPSILPVMGFILESSTLNNIELKMLANYTVKPFLSRIDGVSKIQVMGGKDKEYSVELKRDKMAEFKITPSMIRDVFDKTNFIISNGFNTDYRRLYLSLTVSQLRNMDDLKNLVVLNNKQRIVLLKDIADISIKEKIEYIKINADGKEGVLVNIVKQPNTNLIVLAQNVRDQMKDLQKLLPPGVTIKTYYDQSEFVNESIKSVSDALWIGLLFAIVITFIFLRKIDASLSVLLTIPTTIALTIVTLYALNYTLNLMTLGAIAASVGLIIDDAIVVVEQIHRTREEHPEESPPTLINRAIKYLFPAMVGSSLSTIVIFLPFSFMTGVAGAYFKVLAYTMIVTLVCSYFVTWLGLPVLYLYFAGKGNLGSSNSHPTSEFKFIRYLVKHPIYAGVVIILLIAVTAFIIPRLKSGFLPEMDEGSIVLDYVTPPGTSLEETDAILKKIDKIVIADPDVETYSRRTGTQLGFFITEPNTGDYLIKLKNKRNESTDEVIADIRSEIDKLNLPITTDFGQVVNDMLGDLMSSVQPIEVKIFGDNHQLLEQYAERVAKEVDSVQGTEDVFNGIVIAGPALEYLPKSDELARYGLSPDDLQFQVQNYTEGNVVGNILEKEQLTNIRMFSSKTRDPDIDRIKQLPIFLPDGTLKPINDFAVLEVKKGTAEINRENLKSVIYVTARLGKRDLGSVMKDIRNKVGSAILLPQGFTIVYGGAYAEQQRSFNELLLILITACLFVLSVLLILFREVSGSIIIFFISILGISGSFMALYFTGIPLNVGSYTGVIMIVGIIAENAFFTFHQFKNLAGTFSTEEAIVKAVSIRLRPNLMTATGAIIALMPLALALGTGAQLHQPLAIAVIGGFVIAQILLLVVLPALINIAYRNRYKGT
jgi:CzcA family heavy metal efflux pump